jgi:hypothetical protein
MKKLIVPILVLVVLLIVYVGAILAGFNLPKPDFLDKSIEGDAEVKVTLLMDNNTKDPLANIEVDIAKKPGPPPKGGVAVTDQTGTATFTIKPGDYFIYFNELTFPKNLTMPEMQSVAVIEGSPNEKTILITTGR